MNENGSVINSDLLTRQDPVSGHMSTLDITIVHESQTDWFTWEPLDRLSSNHKPLLITALIDAVANKGEKCLVWNWKGGQIERFK